MKNWLNRISSGFFFISLTTLIYEILLIRILSVLMFYSIVSLTVSLSLFGIGLGALFVYLFPDKFQKQNIPKFAGIYACTIIIPNLLFIIIDLYPMYFSNIINIFHPPLYQPFKTTFYTSGLSAQTYLYLAIFFLLITIPFFFSGITTSLLISSYNQDISNLYFFDLIGASCGSFLVIPLLNYFGPLPSIYINSGLAFTGVFLLLNKSSAKTTIALFSIIVCLMFISWSSFYYQVPEIKFVRGQYEPNILYSKWNAMSRVVVYSGKIQMFPDRIGNTHGYISKTYDGNLPDQKGMVINDTGYTLLINFNNDLKKVEFVKYLINSFVYHLDENSKKNVLIIGPGGGEDILGAYSFNPASITAVELNPTVVEIVNDRFRDFTGAPYRLPRVTTVIENARSFIKYSPNKYDIIFGSLVFEWFEPVAGAFTLSQSNLYTFEGFSDYFNHLTPDGIFNICRVSDRRSLRFTAMAIESLKKIGKKNPAQHIFIATSGRRGGGFGSFIFKKSPLTVKELEVLKNTANKMNFKILYSPDLKIKNKFYDLIKTQNLNDYYQKNEYNFRLATDDKPFFDFLIKPSVFFSTNFWLESSNFEDQSIYILKIFFIFAVIMVGILFAIPFIFSAKTISNNNFNTSLILIYFGCLGFGYMLIEIALMNKFNVLISHPTLSISIILFSMLSAGGFGSLATNKIKSDLKNLIIILLILNIIIFVYIIFVNTWLKSIDDSRFLYRTIKSILTLLPLSFFMGMPFPLGLKVLKNENSIIPWIWSINSGMGVLGAMFAFIFALNFGFTYTLYIAFGIYLLAIMICILMAIKSSQLKFKIVFNF